MAQAETDETAVVLAIVCDGGQCPTCEDGRSLIGPCEDCTELLRQARQVPEAQAAADRREDPND